MCGLLPTLRGWYREEDEEEEFPACDSPDLEHYCHPTVVRRRVPAAAAAAAHSRLVYVNVRIRGMSKLRLIYKTVLVTFLFAGFSLKDMT